LRCNSSNRGIAAAPRRADGRLASSIIWLKPLFCGDLRMSAFVVVHDNQAKYPKPIYFKFCLKSQPDGTHYCHIDCHGSRYA
jgi:hypothetical protein